jgi:urease accessory protein
MLPLANAAHAAPERVVEIDHLCDAFTTNHVANRASRLQGRAFLLAAERVFKVNLGDGIALQCAHLPPAFGCVMRLLEIDSETMRRLFVFQHLRGVIAAAVRLNLVGPMEGQVIQSEMSVDAEAVVAAAAQLGPEDLAQTAPLLDLWQGTQDRLYSRLFQS